VPAAAVIPAPIAYIKVVAVKKLVVEFWTWLGGLAERLVLLLAGSFLLGNQCAIHLVCWGSRTFTLKKLECLKQAYA
jgi:hypothetical protein